MSDQTSYWYRCWCTCQFINSASVGVGVGANVGAKVSTLGADVGLTVGA